MSNMTAFQTRYYGVVDTKKAKLTIAIANVVGAHFCWSQANEYVFQYNDDTAILYRCRDGIVTIRPDVEPADSRLRFAQPQRVRNERRQAIERAYLVLA